MENGEALRLDYNLSPLLSNDSETNYSHVLFKGKLICWFEKCFIVDLEKKIECCIAFRRNFRKLYIAVMNGEV